MDPWVKRGIFLDGNSAWKGGIPCSLFRWFCTRIGIGKMRNQVLLWEICDIPNSLQIKMMINPPKWWLTPPKTTWVHTNPPEIGATSFAKTFHFQTFSSLKPFLHFFTFQRLLWSQVSAEKFYFSWIFFLRSFLPAQKTLPRKQWEQLHRFPNLFTPSRNVIFLKILNLFTTNPFLKSQNTS